MICHEESDIDMKVKLNIGRAPGARDRIKAMFHNMRDILQSEGMDTTFMNINDLFLITGTSREEDGGVQFDISLTQRFDHLKTNLMRIICEEPMLRNYLFCTEINTQVVIIILFLV